jgi:DNA-binding transcriptional MerR regulator
MSLLNKQQVAAMFGVTERTINHWIEKKILSPTIRINNRPKFSKDQIEKMIENGGNLRGASA